MATATTEEQVQYDQTPFNLVYVVPEIFEISMMDIMSNKRLAYDSETTDLDPHSGDVRLVQFSDGKTVWVIDTWKIGMDKLRPYFLKMLLNQTMLVGHNISFDSKFLRKYDIKYYLPFDGAYGVSYDDRVERRWAEMFDTMVATQIIEAGMRGQRFGLGPVMDRVLDIKLDKELQRSDWSAAELTDEQIEYAARDVIHLLNLKDALDEVAADCDLLDVIYKVEMPCLAATVNMEFSGLATDLQENERLRGVLQTEAVEELKKWHGLIGAVSPVNLNSPKQVKEAFMKVGIFLDSTAKEIVEKLDHPAGKSLSRYRSLSKYVTSYCDVFPHPDVTNPITGLSHPILRQAATETGRYAAGGGSKNEETGIKLKSINWQAIPRDSSMKELKLEESFRGLVKAPPGKKVIVADYAQIELRFMAIWSRDPRMTAAMIGGADLHGETAKEVFGSSSNDHDWKWWRDLAKRFNFAVANGVGGKKLAKMSEGRLTEKEGYRKVDQWFDYYYGLKEWFKQNGDHAVRFGFSTTMMGRRRYYPNVMDPKATYREGNSSSIQGSSADLTKMALGSAVRYEWDPKTQQGGLDTRLAVHDEIILYADEDKAEDAKNGLEVCMMSVLSEFKKRHPDACWDVPVMADANIGDSWSEAK